MQGTEKPDRELLDALGLCVPCQESCSVSGGLGFRVVVDRWVSRGRCQSSASWGPDAVVFVGEGGDVFGEVDAVGDVLSVEALIFDGFEVLLSQCPFSGV